MFQIGERRLLIAYLKPSIDLERKT